MIEEVILKPLQDLQIGDILYRVKGKEKSEIKYFIEEDEKRYAGFFGYTVNFKMMLKFFQSEFGKFRVMLNSNKEAKSEFYK